MSFPQFVVAAQSYGESNIYGLFKKGTTYGSHFFRSEVFRIGKDFDVLEVKFAVVPAITDGIILLPVLYFDNETKVSVGTQINSTNYPNGENYIKLNSKSFTNGTHGNSNFFFELRWFPTALVTVTLPINYTLEVSDV